MPQVYFNLKTFKERNLLKDYYTIVDNLIKEKKWFLRYIKNPYKLNEIPGFFNALNDDFNDWHLHHIAGEYISRTELIKRNLYFDQEPWLLKFVKSQEHHLLHTSIT